MTIIIDSLRPNEACRQAPSHNDPCRIDAGFHTVVENPDTHTREVGEMDSRDFLRFRREFRDGQVRFVLDQAALGNVFRGLTLSHGFVPENSPELQAAFNFAISLTPILQDLYARTSPRASLGPEASTLFQDLIDYLMVGEMSAPDRLQEGRIHSLFSRTLGASPEYRQILSQYIIPLLDVNRNRLSPSIMARLDRFRAVLNSPRPDIGAASSTPSGRDPSRQNTPPRINPHPPVPRPPHSSGRALPVAEGVLCALGVVGGVIDSIRIGLSGGADGPDHILMGASGLTMGLGCMPLIGRAVAGAPQNPWLRDGILGGVGGAALGTTGSLIPFLFPRVMMPPRPPQADERNPTMGNGP